MKKILTLILVSFSLISCNRQTKLEGKTYVAEIKQTCKEGIGSLFISRVLKFDRNIVTSSYKVVASLSEVSQERKNGYENMYDNLTKTYKWRIDKGVLILENDKDLGKFKIQKSKLIGYDNDWMMAIEFTEKK